MNSDRVRVLGQLLMEALDEKYPEDQHPLAPHYVKQMGADLTYWRTQAETSAQTIREMHEELRDRAEERDRALAAFKAGEAVVVAELERAKRLQQERDHFKRALDDLQRAYTSQAETIGELQRERDGQRNRADLLAAELERTQGSARVWQEKALGLSGTLKRICDLVPLHVAVPELWDRIKFARSQFDAEPKP